LRRYFDDRNYDVNNEFADEYKFIAQWPFNSKLKMSCSIMQNKKDNS